MNNMLPNLNQLLLDFPLLYRDFTNFECRSGWYYILWDLSLKLSVFLNSLSVAEAEAFRIEQVKEKFGSLRYYTNSPNEKVWKIIQETEDFSSKVCEWCGEPGTQTSKGWILTLCDQHKKELLDRTRA